jgi:nicotinate-nucleotide--dimethylbenzimidazole phosphoribosyltransferase
MARKQAVLAQAAARSDATAPLEVLTQFGGFEIAMMAGALLGAARAGVPAIVDGFIGSAAALLAIRLAPNARGYCIFAHASAEAGHRRMLEAVEAHPLLGLDMRLGEGTGALLAVPLLKAACALLSEVAELKDILEAAR